MKTSAGEGIVVRLGGLDVAECIDWIALASGLAIEATIAPQISDDGYERFTSLTALLGHHPLRTKYSMVMPIVASPLWWLGRALGKPEIVTAYTNMLLFGAMLVALGGSLARDLPGRQLRACLILLVYASMFPNHVHAFYGEVFTAASVSLGVLWLSNGRQLAGYAALGLGAVNTPAALVGVVAVVVRLARRARSGWPLLAPVIVALSIGVEAWLVRGAPWKTGYEGDAGFKTVLPYSGITGFSYPWLLGVLAILMSFGKGLLFFAPGLFVLPASSATDRVRWVHGTWVWFVAGLIVVYAKWWAWYGGWFWGPRFFLFAGIPASLALATRSSPDSQAKAPIQAIVAVAILVSFWVGVSGMLFQQHGLELCRQNAFALESLCHFVPEMSPLWHPFADFTGVVAPAERPAVIAKCAWWMAVGLWIARSPIAALGRSLRSCIQEFLTQ